MYAASFTVQEFDADKFVENEINKLQIKNK